MADRPGAHRTGLQRDPQLAAIEPLVTEHLRRRANRQHFGMGGRVGEAAWLIMGGCDDRTVLDHDRANRHFARRFGCARLVERQLHRFRE